MSEELIVIIGVIYVLMAAVMLFLGSVLWLRNQLHKVQVRRQKRIWDLARERGWEVTQVNGSFAATGQHEGWEVGIRPVLCEPYAERPGLCLLIGPVPPPQRFGLAVPLWLQEKSGWLLCPLHAGDPEAILTELTAAARTLHAQSLGPWEELAVERGLTLEGGLQAVGEVQVRLSGVWDGVPITASLTTTGQTIIQARLPQALPSRLRIGTRLGVTTRLRSPLKIGDPVLDGALSIRGRDPEIARALLSTDTIRPLLMEVLHPHPDAVVEQDEITLVVRRPVRLALEESVGLVVELAAALSERMAALQVSAGR